MNPASIETTGQSEFDKRASALQKALQKVVDSESGHNQELRITESNTEAPYNVFILDALTIERLAIEHLLEDPSLKPRGAVEKSVDYLRFERNERMKSLIAIVTARLEEDLYDIVRLNNDQQEESVETIRIFKERVKRALQDQ